MKQHVCTNRTLNQRNKKSRRENEERDMKQSTIKQNKISGESERQTEQIQQENNDGNDRHTYEQCKYGATQDFTNHTTTHTQPKMKIRF